MKKTKENNEGDTNYEARLNHVLVIAVLHGYGFIWRVYFVKFASDVLSFVLVLWENSRSYELKPVNQLIDWLIATLQINNY